MIDHDYNDFFGKIGPNLDIDFPRNFHWDSQKKQHINTPKIQEIVNYDVDVLLFCRISKKNTPPYVYCGRLEYIRHDVDSANPVHITFNCRDYIDNDSNRKGVENYYTNKYKNLSEVWSWKPKNSKYLVKNIKTSLKTPARNKPNSNGLDPDNGCLSYFLFWGGILIIFENVIIGGLMIFFAVILAYGSDS